MFSIFRKRRHQKLSRALFFEGLEQRLPLAVDVDDQLGEAVSLGAVSTTPKVRTTSITPDTDVDLFSFTAVAGQIVDFDIDTVQNGPGGLGSFIRLFNAQGQPIAQNNDGRAPGETVLGFDAYLRFAFSASGTFYLGVSNANNVNYSVLSGENDIAGGANATGSYQLIVQALPVDPDDTLAEATPLGTIGNTPITRNADINPDIDVDLYSFTVGPGQVVDFDIDTPQNGPGGLGSYLRIFNGNGQQLAFNNDGLAPGENVLGFDAYLRFTFNTPGTYFVGVSNNTNSVYNAITGTNDTAGGLNSIGSYTLIVQAAQTSPADSDDTLTEAFALGAATTTPKTFNGTITPETDVDMFSFTVIAGQVVDFDIDTAVNGPGGLGSFIRLFNPQGTQLASNDNALAPGESIVGFDAYLRFTFATAGTYFLGVSNANNTIYNPTTGSGDLGSGPNATGTYTLVMQALPVDPDDTTVEAAPLGTITANPKVVSADISPDIDVDLYSFNVNAGQVIDFDIDTPLNGPGGLGSYLRIFNSQGQQIAFNNDATAPGETLGFDAYLRVTFATPGTYYVGVSNANNPLYNPLTGTGDTAGGPHSIGMYQLIVQLGPSSSGDPDDTIAEAVSLGPAVLTPKTFNASITPDIDVDMYSFTVTAGQTVDFDIDTPQNGPGGLGSYLRLFNNQGTQIAFNNDALAPGENVVGFDAYIRFTFATAGTYFLGVSNANNTIYSAITGTNDSAGGPNAIGPYTLIMQALPLVDTDDAISEATPLGAITANPAVRSAAIAPDIDVDMYSFTVTTGQTVDFDIDTPLNGPGGLGSYIRIFNMQGQQLAFNNDGASAGETLGFDSFLRFTFAAGGTYYIGVSNANNTVYNPLTGGNDTAGGPNSIGDYQLIVRTAFAATGDPDDTLAEAFSLGAISTTAVTANSSITPDIDVDMFRFTVAADQVVDFDIDTILNGPGGLGSFLRLFNAQGQLLASNNDALAPGESAVGFDAYLRFTFTIPGTYFIGVSNSNNIGYNPISGTGDIAGGPNATGTYQLTVQALPVDTDDTLIEATSLGTITNTPDVVDAGINPDIDVDLYSFTASAGQVIDFDIDTPTNGPGGLGSFLRIFNSQGLQLAFNNDAAAPGEGTVGFDAYQRFTFTTAGTYYVGISNSNNTQYNVVTGFGDTAGGPNSIGNYQLIVQNAVLAPPDPDDTLAEAFNLGAASTIPATFNGSITPDTDVDMFRFTVAAGQSVDFDIDTPLNGPGGLGSFIRLFNSQGQQLAFNNDALAPGENTLGFDAYLRFTFTAAGIYFLGVSNANNTAYNPLNGADDLAGGDDATGNYTLIMQALPADLDDTIVEALALGPVSVTPVAISNAINPDIDVDMYSFSVVANQVVDFDIDTPQNGPGGLGSYLRLFNSQGQQLAFNNDGIAPGEGQLGFDAYLRFTFNLAGTYYIGVSNLNNVNYNPLTGGDDASGGLHSIGNYTIIVQIAPTAFASVPATSSAPAIPAQQSQLEYLLALDAVYADFNAYFARLRRSRA